MTQEEIKKRLSKVDCMTHEEVVETFIEAFKSNYLSLDALLHWAVSWGAKYFWIPVEEDLPPYGEQVLVFAEEDPDYEMWWSERYTPEGAKYKGVSSGKVYEIMTDKNGFASMRDENNEPLQVSHWHRIVPPKHSNSEHIGKNLKGK